MKKIGAIGGILVAIVIGCMTIGSVVIYGVNNGNEEISAVVHTVTKEIVLKTHKNVYQHQKTTSLEEESVLKKVYHFFEKANPVAQFFACIAAILGIVYPIVAWRLEKMPPFKIKSITMLKNNLNNNVSYVIVFKNRKQHFVTIQKASIYTHRPYLITRYTGGSASFGGPHLISSDRVVSSKVGFVGFEVSPYGSRRTTISGGKAVKTNRLFVRLETTSGDQTVKCKKIEKVILGEVEIYNDEYDIDNFWKAKLVYYCLKIHWLWVQEIAKKQGEKWKIKREQRSIG